MLQNLKRKFMVIMVLVALAFPSMGVFAIGQDGGYYVEPLPHKSSNSVTYEQKYNLLGKNIKDIKTVLANSNASSLNVFNELDGTKYGMIYDDSDVPIMDVLVNDKNIIEGIQYYKEYSISYNDLGQFEAVFDAWSKAKSEKLNKPEFTEYESDMIDNGFGDYTIMYNYSYVENGKLFANEFNMYQTMDGDMYIYTTNGIYLNKEAYNNRPVG